MGFMFCIVFDLQSDLAHVVGDAGRDHERRRQHGKPHAPGLGQCYIQPPISGLGGGHHRRYGINEWDIA